LLEVQRFFAIWLECARKLFPHAQCTLKICYRMAVYVYICYRMSSVRLQFVTVCLECANTSLLHVETTLTMQITC